jgi:hypothetical protein
VSSALVALGGDMRNSTHEKRGIVEAVPEFSLESLELTFFFQHHLLDVRRYTGHQFD